MSTTPNRVTDSANLVLVLVNPKAGSKSSDDRVNELSSELRERGIRVELHTDPNAISETSARTRESGELRAVVSVGGDGTAALVANKTEPGVPIAILPAGTENLLAKHFNLTNEPRQLAQSISDGHLTQLDAGDVGDRLFLLMVSCGFDADVVRRLHGQRKGHINHLSYAKPILESMMQYEYPEIRVTCDCGGEDSELDRTTLVSHWAFVFNLPTYAAGLGIVPDADGSDGLLDVCTFEGGSIWHGLYHLSAVMLGQHRHWNDCRVAKARHVRFESEGQVPYQLDGDPGGYLPLSIQIVPNRLTLIIPAESAAAST